MATPVLPENRYGLALHTASADLGLAIGRLGAEGIEASRCQTWEIGREVSRYLHSHLAEFLAPQSWRDLALIAVAKGPGGFTGTRLGVVTARTLAQQLSLPLYSVSTLAAVAWAEDPAADPTLDLAVQMLAQRGEIHGAIYGLRNQQFTPLLPDAVMPLQQWRETLDAWDSPYRLVQAEGNLGSTATSLLELGYRDWRQGLRPHWSEALPFYGQSPV